MQLFLASEMPPLSRRKRSRIQDFPSAPWGSSAGEQCGGAVWERCGSGVGAVWERWGSGVGAVWEGCGSGVGAVWERCGSGVGAVWEQC